MYIVDWNRFNIKNKDKQDAFERMCRHLFMRQFKISGYEFGINYNQSGLETEPIKYDGKYYGFQCKYSTSNNSNAFYKEVYDSVVSKAFRDYKGRLDIVYIYTNLDIKPECTAQELRKKKESYKIKIHKEAEKNNIKLKWIKKENFEHILNEENNIDIYKLYFAEQEELTFMDDSISIEDRTFLESTDFIDLNINGKGISQIQAEIINNKMNIILGNAGTGKTEIIKKMVLNARNEFFSNYKKASNIEGIAIPVFIRLRECVMGDIESLIRNRLGDYKIGSIDNNKFIYYFDGLDEVNIEYIDKVISFFVRLEGKNSTKSIIISSRESSNNLTFLYREIKPCIYKIEDIDEQVIENYFKVNHKGLKQRKYDNIKNIIGDLLREIQDIFSVKLLWESIEYVDKYTSKIDLISATVTHTIRKYKNINKLNLPENKIDRIIEILEDVAIFMQENRKLVIAIEEFQNIVEERYNKLTYSEIDVIIFALVEMFFDNVKDIPNVKVFAFKHRRYHEYFLYYKIKNIFFDDPFILRELNLLTNKDFTVGIFLYQGLKESIANKDLLKTLALRFFEAYLGRDYWYLYKNALIGNRYDYGVGDESYLQSTYLLDYIVTKSEVELENLLNNQGMSIEGFLNKENYWLFLNKYLDRQGKNIGRFINNYYGIKLKEDGLIPPNNINDFISYICKVKKENIEKEYEKIKKIPLECTELERMNPYRNDIFSEVMTFFQTVIEVDINKLSNIIKQLSIEQIEVVSYIMLRTKNIYYLYEETDSLKEFRQSLIKVIEEKQEIGNKYNMAIVYSILTGQIRHTEVIEERFKEVNKRHYLTWENNIEANSYAAILLEKEKQVESREYSLGIQIRKILMYNYRQNKNEVLNLIIQAVKRYNLVFENRFAYNNSKLIGEIISTLSFEIEQVKRFIREILKYNSVVSLIAILYTVYERNIELLKNITNPYMISNIYKQLSTQLSYYDYNTDIKYMYATLIACFNPVEGDKLFVQALNNSIYRPCFRKEDIVSYILPYCLHLSYQNNWFEEEELELMIYRVYNMLNIMKDTTDSGAYWGYFKYVITQYTPDSPLLDELYEIDTMYFEDSGSFTVKQGQSLDSEVKDIERYYRCQQENVIYSQREIWRKLIDSEKSIDKQLPILFKVLEDSKYPEENYAKIGEYFPIITSILLDDIEEKEKIRDFILKQGGRSGLFNMIKTFSLTGDDLLARQYIRQLILLVEALVYPNKEFYLKEQVHNNEIKQVINVVYKTKKNEWLLDENKRQLVYIKNPSIIIKWDELDENNTYHEEWATNHYNPNAYRIQHYILYNGVIIDEFLLISIDGHRALIPPPIMNTNRIERKKYKISLLFNDNRAELDNYIIISGLMVD